MSDDNSTPPSAPAASKRKQSRKKLTPDQRIARLEQQLARAKAEQRQTSRKLQTRGKIIFGAGMIPVIFKEIPPNWQARIMTLFWERISERDRQDLLNSGLLPDGNDPESDEKS